LEEYKYECKQLFNQFSSASSADFKQILPLKRPIAEHSIEHSIGVLEDNVKDANESNSK